MNELEKEQVKALKEKVEYDEVIRRAVYGERPVNPYDAQLELIDRLPRRVNRPQLISGGFGWGPG